MLIYQKLPDAIRRAARLVSVNSIVYVNALYYEDSGNITKSYKYVVDTSLVVSYTDDEGQEYKLMGYYFMGLNTAGPSLNNTE
jgi:hypothetical protein